MTVYEIKCQKCGYTLRFGKGILMSFHQTNQRLIEEMKKGELGENFKRAACEHPDAAPYHSNELYRCSECGELYGRKAIELRGAGNVKLAELEQKCDRCGSKLEMLDDDRESGEAKLPCPRCRENLDRTKDQRIYMLAD